MNAPPSVMIVDDDEDIREVGKLVLESYGYRVSTAKDGLDALETLEREGGAGVILLDVVMPRMDGEQFLSVLRASDKAHIPVVIMSGNKRASEMARELSADGLLRKPIDPDNLLEIVRRFVQDR
jgi:chemosensory pili system protein ChpA (sensor histidine kinase/response regulator)